jgi:hypothetical protein
MHRQIKSLMRRIAALLAAAALALADPPPDPISLDPGSPSVLTFGNPTSDLFGDAVASGASGWDVGGPGPKLHVSAGALGILSAFDDVDGISNGEFVRTLRQFIYFSVDDASHGRSDTPVREQADLLQHAGDRFIANGLTSVSPAALTTATRLPGPGSPHMLSAN